MRIMQITHTWLRLTVVEDSESVATVEEYWLFPAHAQVDQFIAYRFFYLNLPDVNCTCICDVR